MFNGTPPVERFPSQSNKATEKYKTTTKTCNLEIYKPDSRANE